MPPGSQALSSTGGLQLELLKFLWTIFSINLFTIGGGFVMIPLLQKEVVEHYHWLTAAEFVDSIAIGQLTPGPLTIMNAFIGYRVFGLWGAIGAVVSTYLPSVIIVTLVSHYYTRFRSSWVVAAMMKGIRPAVIGLLASVVIILARESISDIPTALIAAGSFLLIALARIDPTFVILGAGALGALLYQA
ncbi:MAG: chromate transporter [Nitrospirales bacterium]|nr:chromate transporter [Nitrospirales bacterium]